MGTSLATRDCRKMPADPGLHSMAMINVLEAISSLENFLNAKELCLSVLRATGAMIRFLSRLA